MYLRQIGKKWYFTIVVKMPDGKKKKIEKVGGKTKKEAREAGLAFIRNESADGTYFEPADVTLEECIEKWLDSLVKSYYAPSTYRTYKSTAKSKIFPAIGEIKLGYLTPGVLQEYLNKLAKEGKPHNLVAVTTILRKALDMAVNQYQWLAKTPMSAVITHNSKRRTQKTPKQMVFTQDELRKIFFHFRTRMNYYLPIQLAYHMGLRAGECLALKWKDVDFENKHIYVHASRVRNIDGVLEVQERTKTGRARKLVMDDKIMELLTAAKKEQEMNKETYQDLYYPSDFVCTRSDGHPISKSEINYFNEWCKRNGINGHFHMLRHTHATMLLEAGMDLDYVSKRLGHTDISLTSSTYLHVTPKRETEAVEIMNRVF